jgi:hypothetical protein
LGIPYAGYRFVKELGDDPTVQIVLRLYKTEAEIQEVLTDETGVNQFSVFPKAE